MNDFMYGRIAAALDEPWDTSKSIEWQCGYIYEITNPSGGLEPQEGEYKND